MRIEIRKAKLYVKLVLIVLVLLFAAVVLCNNRNNAANVWFFRAYQDVNVLKLMLITAVAAVVSFWILTTIFKVWKEWREISKQVAVQQKEQQLADRAKDLDQRERRLAENRAAGEENEASR